MAVDSTVATPVLTQPLALGADIVMHAATKYLNGHSDLIAGTLVTARDDAVLAAHQALRAQLGGMLGPFEAWLLLRGMRTLYPARATCACAQRAAHRRAFRAASAGRGECSTPVCRLPRAMPSRPGRCTAASAACCRFACAAASRRHRHGGATSQLWKRATSLGGVESLIEHRASVEGAGTPVPADLLRLSVGIEDAGDLIADLEQALERARGTPSSDGELGVGNASNR